MSAATLTRPSVDFTVIEGYDNVEARHFTVAGRHVLCLAFDDEPGRWLVWSVTDHLTDLLLLAAVLSDHGQREHLRNLALLTGIAWPLVSARPYLAYLTQQSSIGDWINDHPAADPADPLKDADAGALRRTRQQNEQRRAAAAIRSRSRRPKRRR